MKGHRKGGYDLDNPSTWCEYPTDYPTEGIGSFTCWKEETKIYLRGYMAGMHYVEGRL